MPPTARELQVAEMYRRQADIVARRENKRAVIYGLFNNPRTGRSETYLRFEDPPTEETHDDTHQDPPAE